MRRALADALVLDHPDAPWRPPEQLPPAADIRRAVAVLEAQLTGTDRKHASYCVGKLIAGFNERMTKAEADLRTETWFDACGDIPNDLWSAGTIDLLRSWKRDDHYGRVPDPSDFRAIVHDRLARRALELHRARTMLAKANEPEARKTDGPIREQPVARLRRILREQSEADVLDTDRLFNMANTERALAMLERRSMVDWAQQFFDDRVAAESGRARDSIGSHARTIASRGSLTGQRTAELAAARREGRAPKPWQAAEAVYQNTDEPPPPDHIPEIGHGDAP